VKEKSKENYPKRRKRKRKNKGKKE